MSKLQEMVKNYLDIFVFDLLSVLFLRQHIINFSITLVCFMEFY